MSSSTLSKVDKILPYNFLAERLVLGSILVNPKAIIIKSQYMVEKADGSKVAYIAENLNNKNAIVKMITLEIGKKKGDLYEIKDGLKSGDQLVTSGVRNLKDNIKVEIIK